MSPEQLRKEREGESFSCRQLERKAKQVSRSRPCDYHLGTSQSWYCTEFPGSSSAFVFRLNMMLKA